MKKNVGKADKVIRILIAVIAAGLIITTKLAVAWAFVVGIIGAVMLITAVTGFCGVYKLFGISTCPTKTDKSSGS